MFLNCLIKFFFHDSTYKKVFNQIFQGNIALTDCNYTILNLLRYRRPTAVKENKDQDVRKN